MSDIFKDQTVLAKLSIDDSLLQAASAEDLIQLGHVQSIIGKVLANALEKYDPGHEVVIFTARPNPDQRRITATFYAQKKEQ